MTAVDGPGTWIHVAATTLLGEKVAVWRTSGHGPAVVTAHGVEDSWRGWHAVAVGLGDNYRIYALDLPWRSGNRYGWAGALTPAEWFGIALELVPAPTTVLIGHSFGANAILQYLAGRTNGRDEVSAAFLLAPFFRPRTVAVTRRLYDRTLAEFRAMLALGLRTRLGQRAATVDDELLHRMIEPIVNRAGQTGLLAMFDQFVATADLKLSTVDVPTMVLAGTEDAALAGDRATALAAAMPSARIRSVSNYTHFCHIEQPGGVASEIATFLGSIGM